MIGKVSIALLLLVACARGEEADTVDLKEDIAAAKTKVKTMSDNSVKSVEEINEKLAEFTSYFNSSIGKYLTEAEAIVNTSRVSLTNMTNKYVGEAIDKNKPVSTFRCILKVNMDTQKMIEDGRETTIDCIEGVYNRNNGELVNLRMQLNLIQAATTGLYDVIYNKLDRCATSGAVAELVHQAEVRENNLKKLLRIYLERGTDLRIQFNEGQLGCLRNAQQSADTMMKLCSNKMKVC